MKYIAPTMAPVTICAKPQLEQNCKAIKIMHTDEQERIHIVRCECTVELINKILERTK